MFDYSRQPTSLVISRHYCLRFVLECELKTREQVRSFTFILPMLRIFRKSSFNLRQINSPRFLSVSFALCAGKILIEFSRIVCVSLFSYQGSYSLSLRQLVYFIIFHIVCQYRIFNLFSNSQTNEIFKNILKILYRIFKTTYMLTFKNHS